MSQKPTLPDRRIHGGAGPADHEQRNAPMRRDADIIQEDRRENQ